LEEKIIQSLTLENRERLGITGVEKVDSFNSDNVILSTNKLNVEEGRLTVNGTMNSLVYSENSVEKDKVGLIKKIFR